jgi:hypothetical protein
MHLKNEMLRKDIRAMKQKDKPLSVIFHLCRRRRSAAGLKNECVGESAKCRERFLLIAGLFVNNFYLLVNFCAAPTDIGSLGGAEISAALGELIALALPFS